MFARRMADRLGESDRVRILNDVVLNQVLVRFKSSQDADDEFTLHVIRRVEEEGTCWAGGEWHGMHVMRISISAWSHHGG